jgi:SAM-dependent methyltransferase
MSFKDHFSGHAAAYRAARPTYPAAPYDWLARQAPARVLAWDVACGNGQASVGLAAHFRHVIATDASCEQIAHALAQPRVEYRVEPAEHCSLSEASADLIVVAQALHWLDRPAFYAQVRRVAKPGALLAVWCYGLCTVTAHVDRAVARLYEGVVGRYWPPERSHLETGYADLDFPFAAPPSPTPKFEIVEHWRLAQFCAYLRTWSAVQRYRVAEHEDPLVQVEPEWRAAWGTARRAVRWPLHLRVGVVG